MERNRTCIICGKKYSYCPNCGQNMNYDTWKLMYDTIQCKNVSEVFRKLNGKSLTASEALDKINEVGMPKIFTDKMKKSIDYLINEANKEKGIILKNNKETPEFTEVQSSPELVVEETSVEVSEEPNPEETPVEQPSSVKGFRKRRLERQKQNEEN